MSDGPLARLIRLDACAVELSRGALANWSLADARRLTPCGNWTLADLIAHMTVQQYGFARAVAGEQTTLADWQPIYAADPVGEYGRSCDEVLDAFAQLVDPDRPVLLPEVRPEPLPAQVVVGFHLVDNVVHAWDTARALGAGIEVDGELAAAGLQIARQVPDGERRDEPGSAFAHRLPLTGAESDFEQTLRLLGRDPAWTG